MKSKSNEQGNLKGAAISVLGPKAKIDKSWLDGLLKMGCKVIYAEELDKLQNLVSKTPAKALLTYVSHGKELSDLLENDPQEFDNIGAEIIVIAGPGKTAEAVSWASELKGYCLSSNATIEELTVLLERILDANLIKSRLARYETKESLVERFGQIVVKSPEMKDVLRLARVLATREDSILFVGGIGTGKELTARTIHENSSRRHGPFFSINCRSFSSEDLAVELFGRGEPDSQEAAEGKTLIELSDGGTLLLDEIGVISPNVQGKLQRFLEDGSYTRVNSRTVCKADVRIFASTCNPLDEPVATGEFSEDLYFRLNRFTLNIPALRRRIEDIPVLTKAILNKMAEDKGEEALLVTEDTLKMLMEYHWPGNVRELENVLEFSSLVAGKGPVEPKHLPKQFHDEVGSIFVGASVDDLPPICEIERRYILRVMEATRGNKVRAAEILDINRATLHRKLQMYQTQKVAELS